MQTIFNVQSTHAAGIQNIQRFTIDPEGRSDQGLSWIDVFARRGAVLSVVVETSLRERNIPSAMSLRGLIPVVRLPSQDGQGTLVERICSIERQGLKVLTHAEALETALVLPIPRKGEYVFIIHAPMEVQGADTEGVYQILKLGRIKEDKRHLTFVQCRADRMWPHVGDWVMRERAF